MQRIRPSQQGDQGRKLRSVDSSSDPGKQGERRGEQPDGSLYPEDHPERVTTWNDLRSQAVRRRPGARLIDFGSKLCGDGRFTWDVGGITVRSDGVHLTPNGVRWLTPWLTAQLRADT